MPRLKIKVPAKIAEKPMMAALSGKASRNAITSTPSATIAEPSTQSRAGR
jgi:hypothetical protein